MRKKIFSVFFVMCLMVVLLSNEYIELEYDINIIDYFQKSQPLTEEENAWLQSNGKIIFGSDQSSPPLRYIDERNGQYRGLIIDYIRALSIELKHEIAFEPVEVWEDAFDSLKSNEKDFFDMIVSERRREQFDFTDTLYTLNGVILSNNEAPVLGVSGLVDKKIAIPSGDYAIEYIELNGVDCEIVEVSDMEEALIQLNIGLVDAVAGDEPVIVYLAEQLGMKDSHSTSAPIYKMDTALAVQKGEEELLSILNKGIFNLKRKNVMPDLQQKWFGISESFYNQNDAGKTGLLSVAFVAFVGLIIYLAYTWNTQLKIEVDRQTEELYVSRQKLKVTFDSLSSMMIVVDSALNIINVNKAVCEYLDSPRKKIYENSLNSYDGLFKLDALQAQIRTTFESGQHTREEIKYEGQTYTLTTSPLLEKRGIQNSVLVMLDDVTHMKVAEQKMLQYNKMQAMGVLATGVAHEIRNPLGLIGHYSYLIKTNSSGDAGRQEKAITGIEKAVYRASQIIDNLLNFSRMTSNELKTVNLRIFVESIMLLEEKALKEKGVLFDFECDPLLSCLVREEPLKHILLNLVSNAIDAVEVDGYIQLICEEQEDMLVIKVIDDGAGIEEKLLEQIFTPFYTTKDPGQGTGLGLYIVYNEITKYGGTIEVESELTKGTQFTVNLPVIEGAKTNG